MTNKMSFYSILPSRSRYWRWSGDGAIFRNIGVVLQRCHWVAWIKIEAAMMVTIHFNYNNKINEFDSKIEYKVFYFNIITSKFVSKLYL